MFSHYKIHIGNWMKSHLWDLWKFEFFSSFILILILRNFLKWWILLHLSFDSWIKCGMFLHPSLFNQFLLFFTIIVFLSFKSLPNSILLECLLLHWLNTSSMEIFSFYLLSWSRSYQPIKVQVNRSPIA